jgi:Uri superfamily endonuclease
MQHKHKHEHWHVDYYHEHYYYYYFMQPRSAFSRRAILMNMHLST